MTTAEETIKLGIVARSQYAATRERPRARVAGRLRTRASPALGRTDLEAFPLSYPPLHPFACLRPVPLPPFAALYLPTSSPVCLPLQPFTCL